MGRLERGLRWPSVSVVGELIFQVLMPVFVAEHLCSAFQLSEKNPSWNTRLFIVAILEDICVCYILAVVLSYPLYHLHYKFTRLYNTLALCGTSILVILIVTASILVECIAGIRPTRQHITEMWSNGVLRVIDMASELDVPTRYLLGFGLCICCVNIHIITTVSNSTLLRNRVTYPISESIVVCAMMSAFILVDYAWKDIVQSVPAYGSRYGSNAVHVMSNALLSWILIPFKWGRCSRYVTLHPKGETAYTAYTSMLSPFENSTFLSTNMEASLDRVVHGYAGKEVLSLNQNASNPNIIVFTIETMRAYENSGLRVPMYNGSTVSLTPNLDKLRTRGASWTNFHSVNVNSPGAYYAQEHGHFNDGGGDTYDDRLHGYTEVLRDMAYVLYRLTPDGFESSPLYEKVPYAEDVVEYLGDHGGWFTSKDILLKDPIISAVQDHKVQYSFDPYYLEVRTPGGTHILWHLFEESKALFSDEFNAGLELLRQQAVKDVFPADDGVMVRDFYDIWDQEELYTDMLKTYWLADQFIGETLDELRAKGLAENTLVIVQGDHGHGLEHGIATSVMREQFHVPFVVSDVNDDAIHMSTRNVTDSAVASNLDFGATLLDIVKAPGYITEGIGHSINRKVDLSTNTRHILSRFGEAWIVRNQTHTVHFTPNGDEVDISIWDSEKDTYQQHAPLMYSVPNTDDDELYWLHTFRELDLLWVSALEEC